MSRNGKRRLRLQLRNYPRDCNHRLRDSCRRCVLQPLKDESAAPFARVDMCRPAFRNSGHFARTIRGVPINTRLDFPGPKKGPTGVELMQERLKLEKKLG